MSDERAHGGLSAHDLAVLSHEIRGALTVVSGFSELLRRPMEEAERASALDGIARAVERIDRLIDSASAGHMEHPVPRARVNLDALAHEVVEEQKAVSGRAIELQVAETPVVLGDGEALERALSNLLGNALKYSLRGSIVEVQIYVENSQAVVAVADRGPGIPQSEREAVLRPFGRMKMHADVPGMGLGLTIVSSVAEAHGGHLEIDDREGGGALVKLVLPLVEA